MEDRLLVGMDIDGIEALSLDTRERSDELRYRHHHLLGVFAHAGYTRADRIDGLVRIADQLVADAADLRRRAVMFEEAEQMTLSRLSLSLTLRAWSGQPIDPTQPEPPPLTTAELQAQIDRLTLSGEATAEQLTELRTLLALVTASEAAAKRWELEDELGRLTPGIPTAGWYYARKAQLETDIMELLVTELEQEKLLLGLESGFQCTVDWDGDRYQEIEIQLAYLEWELATRHSTAALGDVGDIIESIGERPVYDQMTFVEMVAGDLDAHPDGLPIALMLLADMNEPHQTALMAGIAENGHLESLIAAVDELEQSLEPPPRSSFGFVGDFVGGVWDSVWGSVTGIWGLTLQGVYDWDGWQDNWAGAGESFQLLFESPGDFLYQVADIDTLRDNPARWAGGLAPDAAAAVFTGGTVTAAAKSGRLGAPLSRIASKLDNLTVRMGARLDQFITNPSLRRMIDRFADDTGAITIGGRPWRLADVDASDLLNEIRRRGDLPDDIFEQMDGHLLDLHVGWTDEELLARMDAEGLDRVSSFYDEATAREVTMSGLTENANEIGRWLDDPDWKRNLPLDLDSPAGSEPLGRLVDSADGLARDASRARIILKKTTDGGWYVLTGFPT